VLLLFEVVGLFSRYMASVDVAREILKFVDTKGNEVILTPGTQENEKNYLILSPPKIIYANFKNSVKNSKDELQIDFFMEKIKENGMQREVKRRKITASLGENVLNVKTKSREFGTSSLHRLENKEEKGDNIVFKYRDFEEYLGIIAKNPPRNHIKKIQQIIEKEKSLEQIKNIVTTYSVTLDDKLDLVLKFKNGGQCTSNSLLHIAAYHGSPIEIFKYFIEEKNIDIKHQRNNGSTVLHEAVFHNRVEIVEYLLTKCNLHTLKIETRSDYMPLHHAFNDKAKPEMAEILLQKHWEEYQKNGRGNPKQLQETLLNRIPNAKYFEDKKEKYEEVIKNFFKKPINVWKERQEARGETGDTS
jgi:hypothetical protein